MVLKSKPKAAGPRDRILTLFAEAREALATGGPASAQAILGGVTELAQGLGQPRLVSVLLARHGEALDAAGHFQAAADAYEDALDALRAVPELHVASIPTRLHLGMKSYRPASFFSLRLARIEALPRDLGAAQQDPLLVVRLLMNLGTLYLAQPQEHRAMERYMSALDRPEIARSPRLAAHLQIQLALAGNLDGGDGHARVAYAEKVLAIVAPLDRRDALAARASLERAEGKVAAAITTLREAVPLYVKAGDPLGQARALADLGHLHRVAGALDPALANLTRAVALARPLRSAITLAYAAWGLGLCLRDKGRIDEAVEALHTSIAAIGDHRTELRSDPGKVAFLGGVIDVFEALLAIRLDQAATDPARFADALLASEQARGQALDDVVRANRRAPRANDTVAPPRPFARLVFHVLADRTAIFAVGADGAVHGHLAALGRDRLTEMVTSFRRQLNVDGALRGIRLTVGDRHARPALPAAITSIEPDADRLLYDALIAPIESVFLPGETVVIEPSGPLWLIPFATLRAADGTRLVDRWPLVHSPSIAALDELGREPAGGDPATLRALLVGNPTLPPSFRVGDATVELDPLPGAEQEVNEIAALFPGRCEVLVGAAADRETLCDRMGAYGVVHLATHGVAFADEPLDSCLAFAVAVGPNDTSGPPGTGLLAAKEILLTVLGRAHPLPDGDAPIATPEDLWQPTDLVILSACQTGEGLVTGDGVIGLGRAFLAAGARAVLVSLWSVSDEATRALMVAFHREYQARGDKARALQAAMQAVRAQPELALPRFWAPFVLIGAPDCAAPCRIPRGSAPVRSPWLGPAAS